MKTLQLREVGLIAKNVTINAAQVLEVSPHLYQETTSVRTERRAWFGFGKPRFVYVTETRWKTGSQILFVNGMRASYENPVDEITRELERE